MVGLVKIKFFNVSLGIEMAKNILKNIFISKNTIML